MFLMIYLDYNATTPVLPAVRDAMWPYLTSEWGNPSSSYGFGVRAKSAVTNAREQVACLINSSPAEVVFTSCATEANNTAIHSAILAHPERRHVITTQVEHSSVLHYCEALGTRGYDVTFLGVDAGGRLDLDALASAIRPDTAIVSIMWANNETGMIFPAARIAEVCQRAGVFYHCDAVQAVDKVAVDFAATGCDYLTLSGHKLGAPKGIGALITRAGAPVHPLLVGGKQEGGRRGGTESVPLIVGLGAACDSATGRGIAAWLPVLELRDRVEHHILSEIPDSYRNGTAENRLPNTFNFGIRGVDGDALVAFMDRHEVCVSSGSACLEQSLAPSYVVAAMTGDHERANEALRVSLGLTTTAAELDRFFELVRTLATTLR